MQPGEVWKIIIECWIQGRFFPKTFSCKSKEIRVHQSTPDFFKSLFPSIRMLSSSSSDRLRPKFSSLYLLCLHSWIIQADKRHAPTVMLLTSLCFSTVCRILKKNILRVERICCFKNFQKPRGKHILQGTKNLDALVALGYFFFPVSRSFQILFLFIGCHFARIRNLVKSHVP